ncbi:quinol oxidase subunit [Oleiphilus messinensis]|uniref:Quinol oxidase subunit n=1 Tax=Oleiphilus messinensis TaxID=141451 RepID=A0A1Y0I601_9GAMM|nr:DoxX family protein [Oleiphilus messinensis]ARU55918.1 quinol oxidase subunit [Oleiphilus messinensis]
MQHTWMENLALLIGRIFMACLFFLAGLGKLYNYEGTQIYMEIMSVPGSLLPFVLILELAGALAIALGIFVRPIALVLAVFCVLAAIFFHFDFSQRIEFSMFMKNLGLAGGLLFLFATGPGNWRLLNRELKP